MPALSFFFCCEFLKEIVGETPNTFKIELWHLLEIGGRSQKDPGREGPIYTERLGARRAFFTGVGPSSFAVVPHGTGERLVVAWSKMETLSAKCRKQKKHIKVTNKTPEETARKAVDCYISMLRNGLFAACPSFQQALG